MIMAFLRFSEHPRGCGTWKQKNGCSLGFGPHSDTGIWVWVPGQEELKGWQSSRAPPVQLSVPQGAPHLVMVPPTVPQFSVKCSSGTTCISSSSCGAHFGVCLSRTSPLYSLIYVVCYEWKVDGIVCGVVLIGWVMSNCKKPGLTWLHAHTPIL